MNDIQLLATLSPSFSHFPTFIKNSKLSGIRFNPPMTILQELSQELDILKKFDSSNVFYDVKGRQLRVEEILPNPNYLELRLNHSIECQLPAHVLFKAGGDGARLAKISENGRRLLFDYNPRYSVKPGESLSIRSPYKIISPLFSSQELQKLDQVTKFGFRKYFLSYVEEERDISLLQEIVGKDSEIWLKIESKKGLQFASQFKKQDNLTLVAARGDLYVELDRCHEMSKALELIISQDPKACVGSRILLSIVSTPIFKMNTKVKDLIKEMSKYNPEATLGELWGVTCDPVPSCADFLELEYLKKIGYRKMLLCDELCLQESLLNCAINAFDLWRSNL